MNVAITNAQSNGQTESKAWQPKCPWRFHPKARQDYAIKLRAVLLPFFERIGREDRSQAQFEIDGRTAYAREFGHPICASGVRALFKRTIDRDNGRNDWMRAEIYLDDYDYAAPSIAAASPIGDKYDHSPLLERLKFKDAAPTLTERQNALEYSFDHFEQLAATHPGQRNAIKHSILDALFSAAPSLAGNPAALRRNWDRKYKSWKQGSQTPAAVADSRPLASGNFFDWSAVESDLQLIVDEAWHHDGKLSLAIRKLRRAGKLSQTFIARYTLDLRRNKSYVARSIREEIKSRLAGLLNFRRSKWAVQRAAPAIARDWSAVKPGDFFAADDCSFNIVWWDLDDKGRPIVVVGEVLLFIDCRSLYPLGYILTPEKYNGETIRRGILNVHDKHGLPHRGFVFERGIWESRLLKGERLQGFLGWDEYEMGLRDRGLAVELSNVTTPGAKVIETVFGIIQQNQRNERGFVGFNQREYGQERLQKFIGRVRRGLAHPSGEFHSKDEWCKALDSSLEYYMDEPQNGELLRGATPAEMFSAHAPFRRLQDDERALLSTHRIRARVKDKGVSITIRGKRRSFYNEAMAAHHGREVYAWFNLEQPDLLVITDLDMKNPLTLKRHVVPAFGSDREKLAEAMRDRNGFMRGAKIRLDNITHATRKAIVRDDMLDPDAHALTTHIRRETEQFEQEQTADRRDFAAAIREAAAAGVPPPTDPHRANLFRQGLQLEQEGRAELAHSAGQAAARFDTGKTFILHSAQAAPAAPSTALYWKLWAQAEKARPGLNRHALTQKAIGCHPHVNAMTPEQLRKMIDVFSTIVRGSQVTTI